MTYFVRMRTSLMRIFRTYRDTRLGSHIDLLADCRHVCKIAKSYYFLRHVCLPVRPPAPVEQLGSHSTDFHDISCLSISRKNVEKSQVS